jgi:multimeric flavodoxin WrbA
MKQSGAEYEIRIRNNIGHEWKNWFHGMDIWNCGPGETVLRGYVRDQSELHGILSRLSDLNLFLISVNPIGRDNPPGKEKKMKTTVISYSLTGNNEALASAIASRLSAEHIRVTEPGRRKMGKIVLDVILNRKPKSRVELNDAENSDFVIFTAPVWMGKAASPLRALFSRLKGKDIRYAYVTVCGGADGPNPELEKELTGRMGNPPAAVVELHIAGLLPAEPKPQRKDTMHYRLSGKETEQMADQAITVLRDLVNKEAAK